MRKLIPAAAPLLAAGPAAAAEGKPFFSLYNTDLIVLAAFIIFLGVLVYAKAPGRITGVLDKRRDDIRAELDEARRLRDEALELHASYERKHAEVKDKAARIVESAKEDAQLAAEQTKADIEASIARRLKAADDRIASAEAAAIRSVRDRASAIAVAAAGDVMARSYDDSARDKLIDDAIARAGAQLH